MELNKIESSEENSSFFYSLNDKGINYWSFLLQGGRNDNCSIVTCQQEALIADEIYKRLTVHDELVTALELILSGNARMELSTRLIADKALAKARSKS